MFQTEKNHPRIWDGSFLLMYNHVVVVLFAENGGLCGGLAAKDPVR